MVVLDMTVMNIALPSAQHALSFSNVDRQWVVTAYSLSFGSLLLFCGRLADLIGRKVTFITGLAGFALASAVGGASVNFAMLVTARACQGVFGALLAPAALSLLTTTFSDPKERGKAFGVYGGAIVEARGLGAVGLLLGGALTEYLSWRCCLYINLFFAGVAILGGALLLTQQPRRQGARLDLPGVLLVSSGVFCLVYGFSNAALHSWGTPSTWGFLIAAAVLIGAFAAWQGRTDHPLLPPRVVLDRNRGAAYLGILIVGAGMFGVFLFVQDLLHAGKPGILAGGQRAGLLAHGRVHRRRRERLQHPPAAPDRPQAADRCSARCCWRARRSGSPRIGLHGDYVTNLLGPFILTGCGM